jgi:fatty-acyl-CoA synthase
VKVDADRGSPVRGEDGLCIACAHGEVGEAVGRIGAADRGGSPFEGCTDRAETEKKILRDVFAEGDAWFCTGDLMLRDEQGYFHFVDRVGDTFRWKGENVATGEVNDAIRDCPVFSMPRPMGSLFPAPTDAPAWRLWSWTKGRLQDLRGTPGAPLPVYALPIFVRFCRALDATETFKQNKQRLIREGFDPSVVGDPLFLRDPATGDYCPINCAVYARIVEGGIRF